MPDPAVVRPAPIREAFTSIPRVVRYLSTLAAAAGGFGVVTVAQGDAVVGLLGLLAGVVAGVGDVLREFRQGRAIAEAEARTTPLADPAAVADGRLVALVVAPDKRAPRAP